MRYSDRFVVRYNYTMRQEMCSSFFVFLISDFYNHKAADLKAATVPHTAMRVETISIIASVVVTFR